MNNFDEKLTKDLEDWAAQKSPSGSDSSADIDGFESRRRRRRSLTQAGAAGLGAVALIIGLAVASQSSGESSNDVLPASTLTRFTDEAWVDYQPTDLPDGFSADGFLSPSLQTDLRGGANSISCDFVPEVQEQVEGAQQNQVRVFLAFESSPKEYEEVRETLKRLKSSGVLESFELISSEQATAEAKSSNPDFPEEAGSFPEPPAFFEGFLAGEEAEIDDLADELRTEMAPLSQVDHVAAGLSDLECLRALDGSIGQAPSGLTPEPATAYANVYCAEWQSDGEKVECSQVAGQIERSLDSDEAEKSFWMYTSTVEDGSAAQEFASKQESGYFKEVREVDGRQVGFVIGEEIGEGQKAAQVLIDPSTFVFLNAEGVSQAEFERMLGSLERISYRNVNAELPLAADKAFNKVLLDEDQGILVLTPDEFWELPNEFADGGDVCSQLMAVWDACRRFQHQSTGIQASIDRSPVGLEYGPKDPWSVLVRTTSQVKTLKVTEGSRTSELSPSPIPASDSGVVFYSGQGISEDSHTVQALDAQGQVLSEVDIQALLQNEIVGG